MIVSMSGENTSTAMAGRKGNRPGLRLLAKGQVFEASRRMEISSDSCLYTNGQGLIKLADGSGWAIVPYQDDLMAQLKSYHGNDTSWLECAKDTIAAYEEIGNALIQQTLSIQIDRNLSDQSREGIIWLRVAHPPNGVKVFLSKSNSSNRRKNDTESRGKTIEEGGSHVKSPSSSHSEVASSVASSSFFDSVWSRVSPIKEKEKNLRQQQQQPERQRTIPLIPCGMVVPVEPWDVGTSSQVRALSSCGNLMCSCVF